MNKEMNKELVPKFALAGNAIITLYSGNTGVHFTYKISRHRDDKDLYFVKLLRGADNNADYSYIGCYYKDTNRFNPCKPWKDRNLDLWPPSMRAIKCFFEHLYNLPKALHVYHEGRCGKCGRRLTTPESIERGFGPECYNTCC